MKTITDRLGVFNNKRVFNILCILLSLYPLRWTFTGLDLWDVGYSCVNFTYFGRDNIGDTWFFSTYLATALGHVFSRLPFGNTLAGLKFLCGLVISVNSFCSLFFCRYKLKLRKLSVLLGGLLAVSLCYIPTVIMYNHLSFLLLNLAVIFMYMGLEEDKPVYLAVSGFFIGINIFVRFSNITQPFLIAGVICYCVIRKYDLKSFAGRILACVSGYLGAVGIMIIVMSRYGISSYISGVKGLFEMTEEASDYKPAAMLFRMVDSYIRGARRLVDIALFVLVAVAATLIIQFAGKRLSHRRDTAGKSKTETVDVYVTGRIINIVTFVTGVALVVYMIRRQLMQFYFHHYITVILTAAMFIDISMLVCIYIITGRKFGGRYKMISLVMLLYVIVLSVGSNTSMAPIMNSMFILAPFTVDRIYKIYKKRYEMYAIRGSRDKDEYIVVDKTYYKRILIHSAIRVSALVLAAFYVQCVLFGMLYCYQEAQNGAGGRYRVENNPVLAGTRMDALRAGQIQELTDYVNANNLIGSEVITYGYSPALPFYLQLKPVINSWPDLDSYNIGVMKRNIDDIGKEIDSGNRQAPIVIINTKNTEDEKYANPEKLDILERFMKRYGYTERFINDSYVIMGTEN